MMVAAGSRARNRAVGCALAARRGVRLAGFPTIISDPAARPGHIRHPAQVNCKPYCKQS
jgi:hypothetical protein